MKEEDGMVPTNMIVRAVNVRPKVGTLKKIRQEAKRNGTYNKNCEAE
jgi:hypothetical protein